MGGDVEGSFKMVEEREKRGGGLSRERGCGGEEQERCVLVEVSVAETVIGKRGLENVPEGPFSNMRGPVTNVRFQHCPWQH